MVGGGGTVTSLPWGTRITGWGDQVLDRTSEQSSTITEAEGPAEGTASVARAGSLVHRAWHFFVAQSFSSLTRRIVFLNVAGLLALVVGILYLSQFRAGLIDARVQSLVVQGEIIASAIAASATIETNAIRIDPDRLLQLQTGESYGPPDDASSLEFPINRFFLKSSSIKSSATSDLTLQL